MVVVIAWKGDGIGFVEKKSPVIQYYRPPSLSDPHQYIRDFRLKSVSFPFSPFPVLFLLMFNLRISDDDEEQEEQKLVNKRRIRLVLVEHVQ